MDPPSQRNTQPPIELQERVKEANGSNTKDNIEVAAGTVLDVTVVGSSGFSILEIKEMTAAKIKW